MDYETLRNAVRNSLMTAYELFVEGNLDAHYSVGRALKWLVDYHSRRNQAGQSDEIAHRAFLAEVTVGLLRVPRPLCLALSDFGSLIETAHETDSWLACQAASAAQFVLEDHGAAIPEQDTSPSLHQTFEEIDEQILDHIKEYGGIAEAELLPIGFPPSHWWWTGNIAFVEPAWVPPPGWPPKRDWSPIP